MNGLPRTRLLFLISSLHIGGAERHTLSLTNNLDTSRFDISLCYLKRDETLLPQVMLDRMQSVFCVDARSGLDLAALGRVVREVERLAIDAIVCANPYSMLYGLLARWRSPRQLKVVEVYHTTILGSRRERLQMSFYRSLFRITDMLVYVCNNQRDYWRQRGLRARAERVIHNGVDVEHFSDRYSSADKAAVRAEFGFSANDYVIGICSALRPEKAHGDLVEALAGVKRLGLKARCLIIGDGSERESIEATAARLQVQADVRIAGYREDVRPYIAACDVMVMPSHAIETFSLAALESMALGKPLVMSRIGGADEQVRDGENGFLFSPGDVGALIGHLVTLADPVKRASMGESAMAIVRRDFSSPRMVEAYSSMFDELLHPRDNNLHARAAPRTQEAK